MKQFIFFFFSLLVVSQAFGQFPDKFETFEVGSLNYIVYLTGGPFFANGTDGLDDATAVQHALDSAAVVGNGNGAAVIVSPGIYHFASSLKLPWRVHLLSLSSLNWVGSNDVAPSNDMHDVIFKGTSSLDSAIIIAKGDGPTTLTTYTQQNSVIQGILFNGTDMTSLPTNHGLVYFRDVQGVQIRYCGFYKSPANGITLYHTIASYITRSSMVSNSQNGIRLMNDSDDSAVSFCIIGLNTGSGIVAAGGSLLRLVGNKVFNNSSGGIVTFNVVSTSCVILGNDLHDNDLYGLSMASSTLYTVTANTITDNDSIGILVDGINECSFTGNTVGNSSTSDQDFGLKAITTLSKNNTFTGNVFDGNIIKEFDPGTTLGSTNEFAGNIGWRTNEYGELYNNFTVNSADSLDLVINVYKKVAGFASGSSSSLITLGTDKITVNRQGLYMVDATCSFTALGAALLQSFIFIAGSVVLDHGFEVEPIADETVHGNISGIYQINNGQTVELFIRNIANGNDIVVEQATIRIRQLTAN